jgi:hypothetical protein
MRRETMATERKPDPDSDRDLKAVLKRAQDLGRGGDTHLVHVGSREIAVLKRLGFGNPYRNQRRTGQQHE